MGHISFSVQKNKTTCTIRAVILSSLFSSCVKKNKNKKDDSFTFQRKRQLGNSKFGPAFTWTTYDNLNLRTNEKGQTKGQLKRSNKSTYNQTYIHKYI